MSQISYRCFCACGGLRNLRLYSRAIHDPRGNFLRMEYYDSGSGPLYAMP